jgi:triacylglycerol lipase
MSHIILLHGLARTSLSMRRLARRLETEGYSVDNMDYPSRTDRIEPLALGVIDRALERAPSSGLPIHFVTHSMGGMLVRAYLHRHKLDRLGRVVMLAPPNQGTEVVDYYNLRAPFLGRMLRSVLGPASGQMRTDAAALPARLGPANFEVGIIAGTVNRNPVFGPVISRTPSDGIVPVERTKLAGMTDFLALPYTHTFIMDKAAVQDQVVHFLQHGRFRREATAALAAMP